MCIRDSFGAALFAAFLFGAALRFAPPFAAALLRLRAAEALFFVAAAAAAAALLLRVRAAFLAAALLLALDIAITFCRIFTVLYHTSYLFSHMLCN